MREQASCCLMGGYIFWVVREGVRIFLAVV